MKGSERDSEQTLAYEMESIGGVRKFLKNIVDRIEEIECKLDSSNKETGQLKEKIKQFEKKISALDKKLKKRRG